MRWSLAPTRPTGSTQGAASCYRTVPLLQLDETAKTATLAFHPMALFYSFFGGNGALLENGHVEFSETAGTRGGEVFEILQNSSAQVVWHLQPGFDLAGFYPYAYRGQRIPSSIPESSGKSSSKQRSKYNVAREGG